MSDDKKKEPRKVYGLDGRQDGSLVRSVDNFVRMLTNNVTLDAADHLEGAVDSLFNHKSITENTLREQAYSSDAANNGQLMGAAALLAGYGISAALPGATSLKIAHMGGQALTYAGAIISDAQNKLEVYQSYHPQEQHTHPEKPAPTPVIAKNDTPGRKL